MELKYYIGVRTVNYYDDVLMKTAMKYFTITIVALFTLFNNASAQTKAELKASKKMYEGRWVNKKAQRHLTIDYDNSPGYANINDWQGKKNNPNGSIDAYKAWVKQGKLVMPESKTDLRCPYCEIIKKGNALLYRCMGMDTKDKRFINNMWFVREKD